MTEIEFYRLNKSLRDFVQEAEEMSKSLQHTRQQCAQICYVMREIRAQSRRNSLRVVR